MKRKKGTLAAAQRVRRVSAAANLHAALEKNLDAMGAMLAALRDVSHGE